jgi:hypothetical protein
LPGIRASLRLYGVAVAFAGCLVLGSCLEPLEPTPVSQLVTIAPVSPFTRGFETEIMTRFEINIGLQNHGTRTIYLDGAYYRLEKLVDQKWVVARETTASSFQAVRTILPGQRVTRSYVILYNRVTASDDVLLSHVRGLYRLHFRLAFNSGGAEELPQQDSYSQPFAVLE